MPIPEDRLYKPDKLNRWFAVSSIIMTVSIFWMIQVDYERPWREFQDGYFVGKAALAHLDYLDATRQDRVQEIDEAAQRLADAQQLADQTSAAQRAKLVADLGDADLDFRKVNGEWSRRFQLLAVTKDTYEKALGKYGVEHPITKEAHHRLLEGEEEVEGLRQGKEKWEDEKTRLERLLKELDAPVRAAEKKLRELEQVAADALKKDQDYRGVLSDEGLLGGLPIVRTLINAPLIDFAATKTTPSRQQVRQLVLPEVRQRLNYLESYTTDRCTTCHVAIDDPEFSKERLASKLERSLPGINEALQRLGHDPLDPPPPPVVASTGETLPVGRVTEFWNELSDEQRGAYFEALLDLVNDYLKRSGRKTIDLGQPLLAHPDLDLYVSINSPHAMVHMGCTVCHEGNPQETDFVQAAHTPPTHEIEERWKEEYYINLLGVPNITFDTVEHHWDRPMRLPKYTEAGCAKCHSGVSDVASFEGERRGARINLGRYLFTTVGCVNCHNVDQLPDQRRVGPDLTHVAGKLTPGFVQQWAFFPQTFRPSTRMPHLFLQENNRKESADQLDPAPVQRTETEVAAISKYLFTVSSQWQPITKPADVSGDAERGRALFKSVGCLACHTNVAEFGEKWITEDLVHRVGIDAETARHRYLGMTYDQRVRYAMEHFVNERDTFLHPKKAHFDAGADYNRPTFSRFAPELSGIGSKVTFDWLYSWVIEPTHYSPDTKMPSLRLAPAEAADIATYLLTLKNDAFQPGEFELNTERRQMVDDQIFMLLSSQRSERRSLAILADEGGELTEMIISLISPSLGDAPARGLIEPMNLADKKLVFLGNKMITHYGCYACHNIAGFETATPPGTDLSAWAEKPIAQLDFAFFDNAFHDMRAEKDEIFGYIYPRDDEVLNDRSPIADDAREEISHTHAAFAKHKMLNPRIWDREKLKGPYDKLKMPNFYFTEEEAEALTTFLLSRIPPRVADSLKIDYDSGTLGPIARGRDLTRELNCVACHQIEDNVPVVQQYFRREIGGQLRFDEVNAPPLLWGEGAKVQHNWLHGFVQHVQPLRPWLQVRMPSFALTGEKATTLVEYFAALSRRDAQLLEKTVAPVDEYVTAERERTGDTPAGDVPPGADWYEQESLKDNAVELRRWMIDRRLMRENELDALHTAADRFRDAHQRILDRVDFMQKLYDVEYPFVEPPTPLTSQERFERGSKFFNDMGCLKCHVLGNMLPPPAANTDAFVQTYRLDGVRGEGDGAVAIINGQPYPVGSVIDGHTILSAENVFYDSGDVETKAVVEGPNAAGETEKVLLQAASAPNLSLTYQRLRRAWVYDWMLEPQWITPGTKMPQNFPGGISPFEGDPEYPGTAVDHINLLVDYLYYAGTANTRAPLAKVIVSDTVEEFDDEGSFDEEEFDD